MSDLQFFFDLVINYWYLGVFLIGFLSSFTIFLPTPAFIVVFILAGPQFGLNPILLGIVGGLGAAVGELVGYVIGYGSKELLLKKYKKRLDKLEETFKKYGASLIIFVFAATPLPFDLIGIFCGAVKYPVKKFFIPLLIGKIVKYLFIAIAGFYGMAWVSKILGF